MSLTFIWCSDITYKNNHVINKQQLIFRNHRYASVSWVTARNKWHRISAMNKHGFRSRIYSYIGNLMFRFQTDSCGLMFPDKITCRHTEIITTKRLLVEMQDRADYWYWTLYNVLVTYDFYKCLFCVYKN